MIITATLNNNSNTLLTTLIHKTNSLSFSLNMFVHKYQPSGQLKLFVLWISWTSGKCCCYYHYYCCCVLLPSTVLLFILQPAIEVGLSSTKGYCWMRKSLFHVPISLFFMHVQTSLPVRGFWELLHFWIFFIFIFIFNFF